jgi:hypothetical protein
MIASYITGNIENMTSMITKLCQRLVKRKAKIGNQRDATLPSVACGQKYISVSLIFKQT